MEGNTNIKPQDFDTLVKNRRSVFPAQYSGEKVSDEVIERMVENACYAPTHKLTQPWRFIVFTGDGILKLAQEQAELYKKVTQQRGSYREDRYQNLLTKPLLSSHIIAVAMKRDEKASVPEVEELGAVFCAIQNMYLTATAWGVGCYLSTGGITYFEEARELFGLGHEDKLVGFLHVGVPRATPPPVKRMPVESFVSWVR